MGFCKNRAIKLHSVGWPTIEDVWETSGCRFDFIEEMGDKFVLSLEEELDYGRTATKLKEMWENQLRSWDNRGAIGEWIGLFKDNKPLPMVICQTFGMF
jgi:hypothetical protein